MREKRKGAEESMDVEKKLAKVMGQRSGWLSSHVYLFCENTSLSPFILIVNLFSKDKLCFARYFLWKSI